MEDIYGYALLPVKIVGVRKGEDFTDRFCSITLDENGVQFFGEDSPFGPQFVEAGNESEAIEKLANGVTFP